jgi:hypothetical protein
VFTPATVPYLRSEYGKEYDYDAPVSDATCLVMAQCCMLSMASAHPAVEHLSVDVGVTECGSMTTTHL